MPGVKRQPKIGAVKLPEQLDKFGHMATWVDARRHVFDTDDDIRHVGMIGELQHAARTKPGAVRSHSSGSDRPPGCTDQALAPRRDQPIDTSLQVVNGLAMRRRVQRSQVDPTSAGIVRPPQQP